MINKVNKQNSRISLTSKKNFETIQSKKTKLLRPFKQTAWGTKLRKLWRYKRKTMEI